MSILPVTSIGNISEAMLRMASQNVPLVLTSTYKGLILNQEIRIIEISKTTAVLQAPDNRICVCLRGHAYLYSPCLPSVITAQIDDLNIEQGKITLSHIDYTGSTWKERLNERIQPMKPIYVEVQFRKMNFRAELDNLSMTGMKLIAYKLFEKGIAIEADSAVRLNFSLPGEPRRFDIKGTIVHFRQVGKLVKFGVRMFPNASQAARMRIYIAARTAEILDELDQECIDIHEQLNAPYLYF